MSDKISSLVHFAYNNLNDRDALAVVTIATSGPVSAKDVGSACGRKHSWLGTRLPGINDKLAEIGLAVCVGANGRGYEIGEAEEPEPEPVALPEPVSRAQSSEPKVHAHFATINGRIWDVRRMTGADADEYKKRVNIQLQGGGFIHIPAPNGNAQAIVDKIIALKKSEEGVRVSDLNEGGKS